MRFDVWVKGIGPHRGAPRVYMDGVQACRTGLSPGDSILVYQEDYGTTKRVVIRRCEPGDRGNYTVSGKRGKGGDPDAVTPVVDINRRDLLSIFEGMESIRVIVTDEAIYLLPLASEVKRLERIERLKRKLADGEPLLMGSLSHGGGVLSHAMHQGMADAGLDARLAFANEIREDLISHAAEHNDAWAPNTMVVNLPMQEVAQDDEVLAALPQVECFELGLPCEGAGRAGRAKRGLSKMEDHPHVGHLVHAALAILSKVQPAAIVLENVELYANTASAMILRSQLRDMGYVCHEVVLRGSEFGSLEERVRWCLVAITKGIELDLQQLEPVAREVKRVADILDPTVGLDSDRWRPMAYLKAKSERDLEKGSNFQMQVVSADDTKVPTLRKGYFKGGSTDPLLEHPEKPGLLRKFNVVEHSRIKGTPAHLVSGLSESIAHQVLGQGIVYAPFRALARRLGQALKSILRPQPDVTAGAEGHRLLDYKALPMYEQLALLI